MCVKNHHTCNYMLSQNTDAQLLFALGLFTLPQAYMEYCLCLGVLYSTLSHPDFVLSEAILEVDKMMQPVGKKNNVESFS